MDLLTSLAVIILAALVHASYQLSVSVLTLLSSHTLSRARANARLLRLTLGFTAGVAIMTYLLVTTATYLTTTVLAYGARISLMWAVACGLAIGIGIAIWIFYYRRGDGTSLWIPGSMVQFLRDRAKRTKLASETFSLGLVSVLIELLFIIAPVGIASMVIAMQPIERQLDASLLYTVISILPLIVTVILVNSGHKISRIQAWREANKHFLQFAAGSALLVLGFYLFVTEVHIPLLELSA